MKSDKRKVSKEMTGSGAETVALDGGYLGNYIVISGRSTGTLTFRARPLGADEMNTISDGTLDLTEKTAMTITDVPIEELEITASTVGAYTVTVYPFDNRLNRFD